MTELPDRVANLSPAQRLQLLHSLGGPPQRQQTHPPPHPSQWQNACLRIERPGNLESVRFQAMESGPPGPGQIQVRAHAVSINFRDLMIAMGMYPPTPDVQSVMGSDYAGEVIDCGPGVTDFSPGDRVMALSVGHSEIDGSIRADSHFCAMPNLWAFQAMRIPANLNYVEAASIPTAFLTAYYSLHHVARLAKGERVLIHSATGGVGLSAIAIARWLGADIVGTAGSDTKRNYLRSIGIAEVYDSRTTAFADIIEGGVDVILNTLAGDAVARGLGLLRPFGRFLQIDKHDISMAGILPLAAFANGLSFTAIDLSLFLLRPKVISGLFEELASHFQANRFRPTRTRIFPAHQINTALHLMSSFRHIGKIVIDYDQLS
ncbi:MAG: zinc-binding dehydrogenase [Cyanobacteriota bacterium]